MKIGFLTFIIFISYVTYFGQEVDNSPVEPQSLIVKKQIIVDDFESQIKKVPFASVRAFVRYNLAEFLWKNGIDETDRAKDLAVKAIDELYEYKSEIPDVHFISIRNKTFALLYDNKKELAEKLKSKYKISEDELESTLSLLDKKDGDKLATAKSLLSLNKTKEIDSETNLLMGELSRRKSPELITILNAIITLEETGQANFSPNSLFFVDSYTRNPLIPNDLRNRYYRVVLNKARNTLQSPNSNDNIESIFSLLNFILEGISQNAPDMFAEANGLQVALSTRVSQSTRKSRERAERLKESTDKISALVSEAEKEDNLFEKNSLYRQASQEALRQNKFELAIDLVGKTLNGEATEEIDNFRKHWHDQFLREIVSRALKKNDFNSAELAISKMLDQLSLVEGLRRLTRYYSKKQDLVSAAEKFDEALVIALKAENNREKIYTLFNLISISPKIGITQVTEATNETAKVINRFSELKIDDKPGTKNYLNYVDFIMVANWNLAKVMKDLIALQKSEAQRFSDQIEKKEVKIIADLALVIESLKVEQEFKTVKSVSILQ